jgi:hypothetical protein
LGYTSLNDVRMMDKNGHEAAVLQSRTRQTIKGYLQEHGSIGREE